MKQEVFIRELLYQINKQKIFHIDYIYDLFDARTAKTKQKIKKSIQKLLQKGFIQNKGNGIYLTVFKKDGIKNNVIGYEPPKKDFFIICQRFDKTPSFHPRVIEQAEKVALKAQEKDKKRRDCREEIVFTIDGEDAKDLDDAVSLKKEGEKWFLTVHIADVSYYVKENSVLDQEAYQRATSIYLVDHVIPMLPKIISNGVCSLHPGEEKKTFSVKIELDSDFNFLGYEFFEATIISRRRFTYREVQNILDSGKAEKKEDDIFVPILMDMKELTSSLRKKRFQEGSIDFDIPELKIICDKKSRPIAIQEAERLFAHNLIEEMMLAANRCAALELSKKDRIGIYRVHDKPDQEKLDRFISIANQCGFSLQNLKTPHSIQNFLEKIRNHPESFLLNTLLLRSMPQAYYHHENIGHFGLNFSHYTHFTSPIRRYPDLLAHRLLKKYLKIEPHSFSWEKERFITALEHSSRQERLAVDMERAMQKRKAIHYLKDKINQVFDGIVSGITDFGIYVTLDSLGIEGLVSRNVLSFMDYEPDFQEYRYKKKIIRLGTRARVRILSLNLKKEWIDLAWVESSGEGN